MCHRTGDSYTCILNSSKNPRVFIGWGIMDYPATIWAGLLAGATIDGHPLHGYRHDAQVDEVEPALLAGDHDGPAKSNALRGRNGDARRHEYFFRAGACWCISSLGLGLQPGGLGLAVRLSPLPGSRHGLGHDANDASRHPGWA